jgi:hypothetical protein
MQLKSIILASVVCVSAPLLAQATPSAAPKAAPAKPAFDKTDAEKAVTELASALEDNFVFPDAGKAYAAMLRANLAKGAYTSFQGRAPAAACRPGAAAWAGAGAGAERRSGGCK